MKPTELLEIFYTFRNLVTSVDSRSQRSARIIFNNSIKDRLEYTDFYNFLIDWENWITGQIDNQEFNKTIQELEQNFKTSITSYA